MNLPAFDRDDLAAALQRNTGAALLGAQVMLRDGPEIGPYFVAEVRLRLARPTEYLLDDFDGGRCGPFRVEDLRPTPGFRIAMVPE